MATTDFAPADRSVPFSVPHGIEALVRWVAHPEEDLEAHLERGYRMLSQVLLPE